MADTTLKITQNLNSLVLTEGLNKNEMFLLERKLRIGDLKRFAMIAIGLISAFSVATNKSIKVGLASRLSFLSSSELAFGQGALTGFTFGLAVVLARVIIESRSDIIKRYVDSLVDRLKKETPEKCLAQLPLIKGLIRGLKHYEHADCEIFPAPFEFKLFSGDRRVGLVLKPLIEVKNQFKLIKLNKDIEAVVKKTLADSDKAKSTFPQAGA